MSEAYEVRLDDYEILADTVTIRSPSIVKGLVRNPNATLALLSAKVAPVKLDDIDVDPQGRIVVKNIAFRDSVSALAGGSSMGNNCNC